MPSTLTVSIPFILLGRRDVLDPTHTTQPIQIILQTLQQFCPTIPIHPWALDTFPEQPPPSNKLTASARERDAEQREKTCRRAESEAEEEWRHSNGGGGHVWILQPAPHANAFLSGFDTPSGWRDTDGRLTGKEANRLDSNVWSCPVLLQRFGVPADTGSSGWSRFVQQAHTLFGVLRRAFVESAAPLEGVDGDAKYWDIVIGENCFLKITFGAKDVESGKKILMLQAAFERELDMLRTTKEVIGFVGVGRWLEWTLLRKMAKEKRKAWLKLETMRHGEEGKEEWKSDFGAEDERYHRTKGRTREWWDVVHDMDETDMTKQMQRSEEHGMRLGLSIRTDRDDTTQVILQGQSSSLNPDYLIAYTELLAYFVNAAQNHSTDELVERLEDLQLYRPTNLKDRFSNMLTFLFPNGSQFHSASKATLLAHLTSFSDGTTSQSSPTLPPPRPKRPRGAIDPFYDLRTYIEQIHGGTRTNMVQFIQRYERAAGYKPTTDQKLFAMLSAEEGRQRQGKCRKSDDS